MEWPVRASLGSCSRTGRAGISAANIPRDIRVPILSPESWKSPITREAMFSQWEILKKPKKNYQTHWICSNRGRIRRGENKTKRIKWSYCIPRNWENSIQNDSSKRQRPKVMSKTLGWSTPRKQVKALFVLNLMGERMPKLWWLRQCIKLKSTLQ